MKQAAESLDGRAIFLLCKEYGYKFNKDHRIGKLTLDQTRFLLASLQIDYQLREKALSRAQRRKRF